MNDETEQLLLKGHALAQQGRYDLAGPIYRRMLESEPDHVDALIALSEVDLMQHRLSEAERHARRAIAICVEEPDAHYMLARILFYQERTVEALEFAQEAIRLCPVDARYHAIAARVLGDLDQPAKSCEQATRGLAWLASTAPR